MAQINIRIDDDLKARADELFEELGLTTTTAFTMFIRQALRQGGIPFEVTTQVDPFYSKSSMQTLRKSIQEAEGGKVITKTIAELREMEE